MAVGMESTKRTVETVGLANSLNSIKLTLMTYQTISEYMMTEVLTGLIGITTTRLWRIEQRQTQGIVGGLIPTVARIVKQGNTIIALAVGQVGPLVGIHLETVIAVVTTAHATQTDIVGSLSISYTKWELNLKQGIERTPVYLVLKIDTIGLCTLVQMDALNDVALAIFLLDNQSLSQATRQDGNLYSIVNRQRSLIECALQDFPSRPSL